MSEPSIRDASEADLVAIQAIYSHHVRHGTASFELDPPDLDEMRRRFAAIRVLGLPYLIAGSDGRVLGYAYAGPYRPRPAYRFSVEDSIYVQPDLVGRGIGRGLLRRLILEAERCGARQMVAVIGDSAQLPSIRLHESCGFSHVGVLRNIGWKFGRWLDSVLMQRAIGAGSSTPAEP